MAGLLNSLPKDVGDSRNFNGFTWYLDNFKEDKCMVCKDIATWDSNLVLNISELTVFGSWESIMQNHCVCLSFSLSQYGSF